MPLNVAVETLSSVTRKITVSLPQERVEGALSVLYQRLAKEVAIPGFRKGKAPRQVLAKHYGGRIEADAIDLLIRESLPTAITEHKLLVVATPTVTDAKIETGVGLKYEATVEVRPEFALPNYKNRTLKVADEGVTEEAINEQLERLRERNAALAPILEDRPLKEGDFAVVDYETIVAGDEAGKTRNDNAVIQVGEGRLIDEFENGLPGMKIGDTREISVKFPEAHGDKRLAGQACVYRVVLKEIKKQDLPVLGDEFAKDVGAESLADLRAKVREEMEEFHTDKHQRDVWKALFEDLLKESSFEVPPAMLQRQLRILHQSAGKMIEEQGVQMDPEATEKLKNDLKEEAERRAREVILLERIIEAENIHVTDADLEAEYGRLATRYKQPTDAVRESYKKPEHRDQLMARLQEAKTLAFVVANNKISH